MQKTVDLQLPAVQQVLPAEATSDNSQPKLSEEDQIVNALQQDTLWLTLLSFLGFGLLLSFTPCIFPMIPILSGIIVGQGKQITTSKAFLLSLCFVLASALTYTLLGILAALFGSNLQATFQQPWIIILFSTIFVLLSLSMFGFYNLEIPKSLQARLHNSSDKHRDGSFIGAGIMGALSALIVGPCVAAPLAGALIYIGKTGDIVLGGSALFAMGFGMGIPLLLMGASAGKLLPKAGNWMNSTKAVFGVIMLAVSVWMLDRILPASVTMLLWAILLIIPSIYLYAIDALPENASGWQKLLKGFGVIMLSYGVILLIGLAIGNTNPLKPLSGMGMIAQGVEQKLAFKKITSLTDLEENLQQAGNNQQWVMLDFYADWCISCKEMEAYTFTDSRVINKLSKVMLLKADVTANSEADKALLKRFKLIGPPGIIFFDPTQKERHEMRIIGYQDADKFISQLDRAGI
jgi:thiol:disulfide interchange protein DsbD